jgi:hypothetical protein
MTVISETFGLPSQEKAPHEAGSVTPYVEWDTACLSVPTTMLPRLCGLGRSQLSSAFLEALFERFQMIEVRILVKEQ